MTKDDSPYFDDNGNFNARHLADDIMDDHSFVTVMESEEIHYYENGTYQPNAEPIIKQEIENRLGSESSRHRKNEVLSSIQDRTYLRRGDFQEDPRYINLANGVYDLKEQEFKDHGPDWFFRHKIPIEYHDDAECPRFMHFLEDTVREEDIPILQEMAGYCLYRDYPFARAFMLLGGGSSLSRRRSVNEDGPRFVQWDWVRNGRVQRERVTE